jgi:hypothetical protein
MDIAIGSSSALPVKLLAFSGMKQADGVQLKWQVSEEISLDRYEIEKSKDGAKFGFVGAVNAANMTYAKSYSWLDKTPNAPVNFFRLKMINLDGSFSYSDIIKIDFGTKKNISVYPNPVVDGTVQLHLNGLPKGNYQLSVINKAGQQISTTVISHSGVDGIRSIPLSSQVKKGYYYIQITSPALEKTTVPVFVQ